MKSADTRRSKQQIFLFAACCLFSLSQTYPARIQSSIDSTLTDTSLRNSTKRFAVVGTNKPVNLELIGWANDVAVKIERRIGIDLSRNQSRAIHIVVRGDNRSRLGRVMTTEQIVKAKPVHSLLIVHFDRVDIENLQEALCRVLLERYIRSEDKGQQATSISVPSWLPLGMAQNLYPSQRRRNSRLVFDKWQQGQLMPLAKFLRSDISLSADHSGATSPLVMAGDQKDPSPFSAHHLHQAISGMLVGWISSLPEKTDCFEKIFTGLAAGRKLSPGWFAACIPECDSITDLEAKWDNWVLLQKRKIYAPGVLTSRVIDQFKAELLLYPGNFGIPLSHSRYPGISLRDLIEKREAQWIPVFSASKSISLRLLAVGRGKEFSDVVESYCRYLDALGQRESKKVWKKLLNRAEKDLSKLTMQVK